MTPIDLLIKPQWLVPIVPEGAFYEDCAIAINEGRIEAIVPVDEAERIYQAAETLALPNQVLMPGLVNAHGHTPMTLLRGYADDHPLETWLSEYIWPAEAQWVNEEFVADGTRQACAEMIRSGTTCFADMYFFPNISAKTATEAGMRARVTFPVIDFPSPWAQNADEYIRKGLDLHDQYKNHPLVNIAFGPHAPYSVGDETFQRIAVLTEELNAPIQVHLQETRKEIEDSIEQYGLSPVARLEKLGILGPGTEAVHMTQASDEDIDALIRTNTSVIHCPKSNLKLASGYCPVATLLDNNIKVGLGTDGAASNNSLNMLEEMRFASLLAKAVAEDPTALSAEKSLRMATLGGAEAIGMDAEIGSLEAGKAADMISIKLDNLASQPLYDLVSQIVYAVPTQAHNSWVNGKLLMKDGQLTTLNEKEIFARSQTWADKISGR